MTLPVLAGAIPYACDPASDAVGWIDAACLDFSLTFFTDTIRAAHRDERRPRRFGTGLRALEQAGRRRPEAVVFSMGRCGSTLVTRLLERPGAFVCLREPSPINDLLVDARGRHGRFIAGAMAALAAAAPERQRYLIKLSSWNLIHADLIAGSLPGIPLVVMRRDPEAILASLRREPAAWTLRGDGPLIAGGLADLLCHFQAAAAGLVRGGAMPVDYDDLPAGAAALADLLGLPALPAMVESKLWAEHARHPGRPYPGHS